MLLVTWSSFDLSHSAGIRYAGRAGISMRASPSSDHLSRPVHWRSVTQDLMVVAGSLAWQEGVTCRCMPLIKPLVWMEGIVERGWDGMGWDAGDWGQGWGHVSLSEIHTDKPDSGKLERKAPGGSWGSELDGEMLTRESRSDILSCFFPLTTHSKNFVRRRYIDVSHVTLLHPASAEGVIVFALCVCVCLSVCVSVSLSWLRELSYCSDTADGHGLPRSIYCFPFCHNPFRDKLSGKDH